MKLTLFLAAFFIGLTSLAQEPKNVEMQKVSREQIKQSIREYILHEVKRKKIIGLSVAVVDEKGTLLSEGIGYADKENKILSTDRTLFPVASISKTFTGTAVMQLAEKGLIDLDKPICEYIEKLHLPGGEEKIITTRMLLTHHSGIQGDILYNWYLPEVSDDPLVFEEIIDLINHTEVIFEPGKMHSYSNSGYSLLGVLIHKISGIGYVDYIRTNILSKAGMNDAIVFAGEKTENRIALGYNRKNTVEMPMKLGIPAGGAALSSNDAAKYIQAILDSYHGKGELLKPKTARQMMTRQNSGVPVDKGFAMGLSWFLQHPISKYTKYASHRGELPPYHAMLVILPELKIGVFIGTNTNKAAHSPYEITHHIVEILAENNTEDKPSENQHKVRRFNKKQNLKLYEGYYPNVYFGPMKITARNKKLKLKSTALPLPMQLIPCSDSSFCVKLKLLGFIPVPVKMLNALKVEFREVEQENYLTFIIMNTITNPNIRIDPYPSPKEFKNYIGRYKVVNMNNSERVTKDVKIIKSSDFYILKYTFLGRHKFNLTLKPVNKNTAKIAGVGQFMGESIRWKTQDGKLQMHWSGLVLEKVK